MDRKRASKLNVEVNFVKRTMYAIVTGAVLVAFGYALYEFTRTHPSTMNLNPDYNLPLDVLMREFEEDFERANGIYTNKIVQVTGRITEVEINKKFAFLFFENKNRTATLKCSMEILREAKLPHNIGDVVKIRGLCIGGQQHDFGLGLEISMLRCLAEKTTINL